MTHSPLLHLSPRDNVCAATRSLQAGDVVPFQEGTLQIRASIPVGHKVAVLPIQKGRKVLKYGASIGSAICDIAVGEHVHTHNLESDYLPSDGRGKGLR